MFKKAIAPVLGLLVALGIFGLVDPVAMAQLIDPMDSPSNITNATGAQGSARAIARDIINYFLFFLGLIATVMIIIGGFYFITGGSGDGKEKGKTIIMYAAIGIIVVLVSFALVNTLLGAASNVAPTV